MSLLGLPLAHRTQSQITLLVPGKELILRPGKEMGVVSELGQSFSALAAHGKILVPALLVEIRYNWSTLGLGIIFYLFINFTAPQ
jgi:hypothetical protein